MAATLARNPLVAGLPGTYVAGMAEPEQYEHIPWEQLVEPASRGRRTTYAIAALVMVVAAAIAVVRVWPAAPQPIVSTQPGVPPTVNQSSSTHLYTEDELRANEEIELWSVAAKAEWFVADYFTIDGSNQDETAIESAFPSGWPLPDLPQGESDRRSFVEWARTVEIQNDANLYNVVVAFRVLEATATDGYQRLPIKAVRVTLEIKDGGLAVSDIPQPWSLPSMHTALPQFVSEEPPAEVVAQATTGLEGWGTEPRIESAWKSDTGWRMVVSLADELGHRWSLARFVEETH